MTPSRPALSLSILVSIVMTIVYQRDIARPKAIVLTSLLLELVFLIAHSYHWPAGPENRTGLKHYSNTAELAFL